MFVIAIGMGLTLLWIATLAGVALAVGGAEHVDGREVALMQAERLLEVEHRRCRRAAVDADLSPAAAIDRALDVVRRLRAGDPETLRQAARLEGERRVEAELARLRGRQ